MKHIHFTLRLLLGVFTLGFLVTGCITEDLDKCPVPTAYTLTLKVVNTLNEDITESERVTEAAVYVFDNAGKYLETVTMNTAEIKGSQQITLKNSYKGEAKLQFLVWGNAYRQDLNVIEGSNIEDFKVQLKSQEGVAESPSDLFGGNKTIALSGEGALTQDEEIVIEPKIGRMMLRTDGLQYYMDNLENQGLRLDEEKLFSYSFDNTLSEYNYQGTLQGSEVHYIPESDWNEAKTEWETDWNNAMPVELAAGTFFDAFGEEIQKRDRDDDGNIVQINPDEETEVVFRWDENGTFIGIKIIVRPWGFVDDPIEW